MEVEVDGRTVGTIPITNQISTQFYIYPSIKTSEQTSGILYKFRQRRKICNSNHIDYSRREWRKGCWRCKQCKNGRFEMCVWCFQEAMKDDPLQYAKQQMAVKKWTRRPQLVSARKTKQDQPAANWSPWKGPIFFLGAAYSRE